MRVGDGRRYRRPAGAHPFILVGYDELGQTYTVEYIHNGRRYFCPANRIIPWEGQTLDEIQAELPLQVGDRVAFSRDGVTPRLGMSGRETHGTITRRTPSGRWSVKWDESGLMGVYTEKGLVRVGMAPVKPKRKTLVSFLEEVEKKYA